MRDPQQFPKYLLVGVADAGSIIWRIQRASDMAICGIERSYVTDDGVHVMREPKMREWFSADMASAYLTMLEDGVRHPGDEPVAWIPEPAFFTQVDGPIID